MGNMKADELIITDDKGKATKYADMKECDTDKFKDAKEPTKDCTTYGVASATVKSDGWTGSYKFPQTYNYGEWKKNTDTEYTADHKGTGKAPITCIRPASKNIQKYGSSKAIFMEYKFEISGIEGTQTTGNYMVYDPTVSTQTTNNQGGGGGGAGSTTSKSGSGGTTTAEASAAADAQVFCLFLALSLLGISW